MDVLAPEARTRNPEQGTAIDPQEDSGRTPGAAGLTRFTRRHFLGAAGAAAAGLALYAGEIARHELVTEPRTIQIANLPESFDGFRAVQISDFHYAAYTEPFYLHRMVERVNALQPDLVLLTGDFVSMSPLSRTNAADYIPLCAAILGRLTCPLRYGVLGNHDWMVDAAGVQNALKAVGIEIFVNESAPIERGGKRIWLAGVADGMTNAVDIPKAMPAQAAADGEPVIMMCHEPDLLDEIARYGPQLMLSGHTHGGQVRLPFLKPYFLPPLGKHYVAGHFLRGRTQLYVNRGIGAVGLPFRFNCPSEITEFTLRPA